MVRHGKIELNITVDHWLEERIWNDSKNVIVPPSTDDSFTCTSVSGCFGAVAFNPTIVSHTIHSVEITVFYMILPCLTYI
jgi:hypothetical protein